MGYIYLIKNNINGKKYIGQTIQNDINKRWNKHKLVNKSFIGTCLYNAYKKYGVNNFKAYENNFSGVILSKTWMNLPTTSSKYFCLKKDNLTLLPYATFDNINQNIDFLISYFKCLEKKNC